MTRSELTLFIEYFFKLDDRLEANLDQLILNHLTMPRKMDNLDALDLIELRSRIQEERQIRDDLYLLLQVRDQIQKQYEKTGVSKGETGSFPEN